jgi:predicted GNAT superfamily acetyltransferase
MSITLSDRMERGGRAARRGRRAAAGAIAPIVPAAAPAILALNNAHAVELSWLAPERLSDLLAQACYARRIGAADAFLLALDERATYDSPNYLWFRERYRRFVYVDRIVVADAARGRGHARALYADLFRFAAAAGHDWVLCEINLDPPNPASDALHARLGFAAVGRATIHGGAKTVRYFARPMHG